MSALSLAIEVLSPTTARADDERPEIVTEQIDWRADALHPPLIIDLPAYFRDVTGE